MAAATTHPIQLGGLLVTFLADAEDTGGSATMFETRIAPGSMVPPPHSHDGFEETLYGLEGETTLWVDDVVHVLHRGDTACVRRGQVHRFTNSGEGDAGFLSVASPGLFGPSYFTEIAAAFGASDKSAIREIMQRHGLTPAAPSA